LRATWRLVLYAMSLVASWVVVMQLVYPVVQGLASVVGLQLNRYYWLAFPDWLALAAVVVAHALMLGWIERRPWRDVGLGRDALGARRLALGAALGAAAIGVPSLLLVGARLLRVAPSPGGAVAAWLGAAAALLARLAPAALFEELVFRGYPFMVLRESAGPVVALVVTAVAFGAAHVDNPGVGVVPVAMVILAGLFLGAVLLVTGSLWAAVAAHLAWNWTLGAALHSAVSGLPFVAPGYHTVDAGPDWVTGGAWGPEGGLAAGVGMLSVMALLLRRRTSLFLSRGREAAGDHIDA
jgi:hypothetical protein